MGRVGLEWMAIAVVAIGCGGDASTASTGTADAGSTESSGTATSADDDDDDGSDDGPADECRSSAECEVGACVRVSCDFALPHQCGFFACQDACSSPFEPDNGVECLDDAGCCGPDEFCTGQTCSHISDETEDSGPDEESSTSTETSSTETSEYGSGSTDGGSSSSTGDATTTDTGSSAT